MRKSIRALLLITFLAVLYISCDDCPLHPPDEDCIDMPQNMVGWWECSDIKAHDLIYGNHGELVGNVTFSEGKVGPAFNFDGQDSTYINIGNPPELDITGELTLAAWVYIHEFVAHGGIIVKGLMYQGGDGQGPYGLGVNKANAGPNSQKAMFEIRTENNVRNLVKSPGMLEAQQWYFLVGTFTPGEAIRLYIDGALIAEEQISDSTIVDQANWPNSDVRIGDSQQTQMGDNYPGFLNGIVDEPMIFDRALSNAEILAIYLSGSNGVCKPEI